MKKCWALALALCFLLTGCEMGELPPRLTDLFSHQDLSAAQTEVYSLENLPAYSGEPYVTLNEGQPDFPDTDKTTVSFERYSQLDYLGRCGAAYANVGQETMPTEERGAIGMIKPSGWHTVRYDFVDGKYLYNRCHLIGYQLTGENANPLNLITGTRYLNVTGMLPFENQVADYVKDTGNHVLYRVTPIFDGTDLVAQGVEMEAWSVEDQGEGISFHVFVYNVQPGVTIDYATGESYLSEDAADTTETAPAETIPAEALPAETVPLAEPAQEETTATATATPAPDAQEGVYILNTRSRRFHLPTCSGAATISEANRQDYEGSREELVAAGYVPCGQCQP